MRSWSSFWYPKTAAACTWEALRAGLPHTPPSPLVTWEHQQQFGRFLSSRRSLWGGLAWSTPRSLHPTHHCLFIFLHASPSSSPAKNPQFQWDTHPSSSPQLMLYHGTLSDSRFSTHSPSCQKPFSLFSIYLSSKPSFLGPWMVFPSGGTLKLLCYWNQMGMIVLIFVFASGLAN